jgi:methylated-DNA-protein-cysteine methyltransferase-like protein
MIQKRKSEHLEERALGEKLSFSNLVVRYAREVPPGRVTTYGALSRAAGGGSMGARSITSVLAKAWNNGIHDIPFHRIVYSDGRIWMAPEYEAERTKRYKQEKIEIENGKIKDFHNKLYEFK